MELKRVVLFLAAVPVWGAAGDISAVRVINNTCTAVISTVSPCNGSVAEIDISQGGGSTPGVGGSYALGFGTNNSSTSAKVVFTVTSLGYTIAAGSTTITRTVYGTYQWRKPYPNNATIDEAVAGGTLTVRLALSDFVYSSDTATVTITAPSGTGFYNQGGVQAGSTAALSVTNNSTQAYPTSICRWAWPVQFTAITGDFTLEAVCFNRFAQNGKPLAAVVFTVSDASAHSVTYTVNDMTKSTADAGDQYTVQVYKTTVATSTLTHGDTLTANIKAYPWVGDSGAVYDSNSGTTQPDARMSDLLLLNNKSGTYSGAFAIVDPAGGGLSSNATTKVYASRALAEAAYVTSATNSYTTAGYAFDALKGWNNANATPTHNDPGGGTVLLVGTYNYTSTGRWSSGPTQKTWVTVGRVSTVAKASAIWTDTGSSFIKVLRLKIEDITISGSGIIAADDATTGNALWLHNIDFNATADGWSNGYAVAYATKNSITALRNGFTNVGTTKSPWGLVRGNLFPTATTPIGTRLADMYCIIGNKNVRLKVRETGDTSGAPISSNSIVAFNGSFTLNTGWAGSSIAYQSASPILNVAIVENVIETSDGSGGEAQLIAAADNSTETSVDNYIFWHNTFVGQRTNLAYNDNATNVTTYRTNWSVKYNNFDDINMVTDIDTHAGNSPNAAKIGNLAIWHGVGLSGNCYYNRTASGASNTYSPIFDGILGHRGNNEDPLYVHNYSYSGTSAGGGDYHSTASSPFKNMVLSGGAVLPYDLDGVARRNDGTGAAGAYESAAANRGIPAGVIW